MSVTFPVRTEPIIPRLDPIYVPDESEDDDE